MKHVKTLNTQTLQNTMKKGGCGECQTSCQSACKTSCTVEFTSKQRLPSLLILRMEFELERGTEKEWFTSTKIMVITSLWM